jgi:hypothetical protein
MARLLTLIFMKETFSGAPLDRFWAKYRRKMQRGVRMKNAGRKASGILKAVIQANLTVSLLLLPSVSPARSSFSLDLLSVSAGSWIVTPTDHSRATEYYNKFSVTSYLTFSGFKGFAAVPLSWSVVDHPKSEMDRDQLWAGNVRLYVGRRLGLLEPRIGAIIPTGYSTDFTEHAWIGTGNFEVYFGVGLNPNLREEGKFGLSGELMARVPLPTGEEPVEGAASWSLAPSAKASYQTFENVRIGAEVLSFFSKSYYYWNKEGKDGGYEENDYELGFSIVPHLYTEITLSEIIRMTAKVGYGPSYKNAQTETSFRHSSNTTNLAIAVHFYL